MTCTWSHSMPQASDLPSSERLLVAGWKEISLVDVIGSISFTLWLALCNLNCPWCANASLARGLGAKYVPISEIVEAAQDVVAFVDYFHVTGGEPLLQYKPLTRLLARVAEEMKLKLSLDTNATLPEALNSVLNSVSIDHLAIDVKAPLSKPELYARVVGYPPSRGKSIVDLVKEGLKVACRVRFLELRTTLVPGLVGPAEVREIAHDLADLGVRGQDRTVFVVQQFIPYSTIVSSEFRRAPRTPLDVVREAAALAKQELDMEVYLRSLELGTVKV